LERNGSDLKARAIWPNIPELRQRGHFTAFFGQHDKDTYHG
jgi:hypothetical protein